MTVLRNWKTMKNSIRRYHKEVGNQNSPSIRMIPQTRIVEVEGIRITQKRWLVRHMGATSTFEGADALAQANETAYNIQNDIHERAFKLGSHLEEEE